MGYFNVGNDWDGLAGLDGSGLGVAAPQVAVRRAIPIGSIVPTLRARKPYAQKLPTAAEASALRAARLRTASRLRTVLAMPSKQLVPIARTLVGFSGFGIAGDEGAVETLRGLSGSLHDAYAEIGDLGISEGTQALLGGTLLGQRAGEISGALGIDVAWRDLVQNAGPDFARIRNDLQSAGVGAESILTTIGFQHIGAVFRDQSQAVASLRNLAGTARGLYDRYGADVMNYIAGDAGAFGEGGLRRMIEGAIGEGAGQWLNGANLQRLGGVAQAWIGAGSSGSASGYVSAVGATFAAVGTGLAAASVVVPWGTIVAAAGALITLLASLLGDEQPPPPPAILPCEGTSPKDWQRNPEAWAALSMWLVAKDGKFFDSDYYKEAETRGVLVQQLAVEEGWFATIDRYTGEVMVRAPGVPGHQPPMRRLLDVLDRGVFLPPGSEAVMLDVFDRMRPVFGMEPRSTRWGGTNFLWCQPHPMETLTRFLGAEQYRIRGKAGGANKIGTGAFRSDPDQSNPNGREWRNSIGSGFEWGQWISNNFFWKGYMRTMALSMYLGGTIPYGARGSDLPSDPRYTPTAVYFSTGVGGSADQYPIELRVPCSQEHYGAGYPCRMPMPGGIWIPDHSKSNPLSTDGEEIPFEELPSRLADQEWCLAHRVPQPSPDMRSDPGDTVQRSSSRCTAQGVCVKVLMRQARLLAPGSVFKREEPGEGMGRGAKIALGVVGGGLAIGGGYLAVRHLRRRG